MNQRGKRKEVIINDSKEKKSSDFAIEKARKKEEKDEAALAFQNNIKKDPFWFEGYELYIVAFSGGKDSIACFLRLLDLGIPKHKIELWHHDIDGQEGSELMDWNITKDYCKKFAKAFDVPIYYSWRVGGFEAEMLRENSATNAVKFETPTGLGIAGGKSKAQSTRRLFPQVTASLAQRWCSAALKIDVCRMAINNQERLLGKKMLLLTGERAEESSSRANYMELEQHNCSNSKRTVHGWRPVHQWKESEVWHIIEKYKVNPHPAYQLGWGRVSCAACIFGNKDQWASLREMDKEKFDRVARFEKEFGKTIHRTKSINQLADSGEAYDMADKIMKLAKSHKYSSKIILKNWKLPLGAYGDSCGPT